MRESGCPGGLIQGAVTGHAGARVALTTRSVAGGVPGLRDRSWEALGGSHIGLRPARVGLGGRDVGVMVEGGGGGDGGGS